MAARRKPKARAPRGDRPIGRERSAWAAEAAIATELRDPLGIRYRVMVRSMRNSAAVGIIVKHFWTLPDLLKMANLAATTTGSNAIEPSA